ncbi:hypothetical protein X801_01006 [Opisthorchis viverrini]|uniref:Uncharacterized protein n=2 Tax=Opisthorchis viverrini TaxID=6198 RepID=A0A075AEG4_OPIVI|nr:hypothetical protein T265_06122 [Opisthorchis viverrini]KER26689.1 hypothetical protein T265_06122 [Opisthorchis viverrini]OON23082.1 hypothetical protein X801_01006 [Opisthorchis viverrini]
MIVVHVSMRDGAAAQTSSSNVHNADLAFQLLVSMWEFIQIGKNNERDGPECCGFFNEQSREAKNKNHYKLITRGTRPNMYKRLCISRDASSCRDCESCLCSSCNGSNSHPTVYGEVPGSSILYSVCATELCMISISLFTFTRSSKENFLPPVREERLVDSDAIRFLPNNKRPSLFKGKVFYVLTHAHFSELSPIVRLGGGKVILLDSSEAFVQHYEEQLGTCGNVERDLQQVLRREGSCVIHAQNVPGLEDWQRTVYSALRGIRRRPILESELGFAVLYISTNGYCNPETKCPEKLYQEAGVSQALSVNPFHLDSQADGSVLTERSLNPKTAPFRSSLKRSRPLSDLTESNLGDKKVSRTAEMISSETSGASSKRPRKCTNIVPPCEIPCIPKSKCLVADSETLFHSPGNIEKRHPLSTCSEQSNMSDHTTIQSKNMVKPTELMKENIAPLFRATENNVPGELVSHTSLRHQTENFVDEQDALAALNSMPSLFPLQISRESVAPTRVLKDLSPSNKADLSNPDRSTVSVGSQPAICTQAELRKLQLSSTSSPNSVTQQQTSSPVKATHPPPSVGLAGWLSKNTPMTPTDSDNVTEPVVPTHPPIELMDLIVPTSIRARRVVKDRLEVGPNYKTFKKVWPVYMGESPVAVQTKRSNGHFATARVDLTPFVPDCPRPADVPNEEPACMSEQEERARIDRLFQTDVFQSAKQCTHAHFSKDLI